MSRLRVIADEFFVRRVLTPVLQRAVRSAARWRRRPSALVRPTCPGRRWRETTDLETARAFAPPEGERTGAGHDA